MKVTFVLLLSGALSWPLAARGAAPDSATLQKGRIWTLAVHKGWPNSAGQNWVTKDSLDSWLKRQPGADANARAIKTFTQKVLGHIAVMYGSPSTTTPLELAAAVKAELRNQLKTPAERAAFDAELTKLVTASAAALPAPEPPKQAAASGPVDNTANKDAQDTVDTAAKQPDATMDYKTGLGGLVIGLIIGYLVKAFLQSQQPPAPKHKSKQRREDPHQAFNDLAASGRKSTALPPRDTQPEPPAAPTAPTIPPMPPLPEEPEEDAAAHTVGSEVHFEVASVPAPSQPTQFFGPAPDRPYIEARKLSPQSLPQMPICLTLKMPQATTGTFTLNPYAEQSRLIGNGIRELKTFFDFDLPLPDYFTSIKTTRPGKMELRNEEWHLLEKAKIELK